MDNVTKYQHVFDAKYYESSSLVWEDKVFNLVPDVGLNQLLDNTYKTKTPAANYFIGLINGPSGSVTTSSADTMTAHAGWAENSASYSNATRPSSSFGTVAAKSVSNSAAPAVFNITGSATIAGCFLVGGQTGTADTKGGTGGTLMGEGFFSSGDKAVSAGGTLTVTVTANAASA